MKCEFCLNDFSNKTSLTTHQRTAKYCLKLQNISNIGSFICKICDKAFIRKSELLSHSKSCKKDPDIIENELLLTIKELDKYKNFVEMLEKQIEEQKQTIKELQDKLENIAVTAVSRSNTSTTNKNIIQNNYIQNLQPVTDETFSENISNLTIDHIMKGPIGYAEYALGYPLKKRLMCVDYARKKIKFKDKDGNVITDPEMTNLATKFFKSIQEKNTELILSYKEEFLEKYGDSEFDSDEISKMIEYMLGVKNAAKGEKTDFHHDFVKQICNKTINEDDHNSSE